MDNFSFKRDLKFVDWKATLQVNVMRAAAAGFIIGTVMALMLSGEPSAGSNRLMVLAMPLIYAVVLPIGLPFYFAMAMFLGFLSDLGVPFVGLFNVFLSFIFAIGDPFLFLLHRSRPDLVPLDQPSFFTLRIVIFVLDPLKGTYPLQAPSSKPSPIIEPDTKVVAVRVDTPSCPVCGAANKASAKFCRQCGSALGVAAATRHPSGPRAAGADAGTEAPPSAPRHRDAQVTQGVQTEHPPMGVAEPAPPSEAPPQEGTRRTARRIRPALAIGVGAAVIVVAIAVVMFLTSRHESDQRSDSVTTRSGPVAVGRGTLQVEVNVPARATLDGWHLPDAGTQAGSMLVFSNVEATTHTLEVWSEGYRRESSTVAVKPDQTTRAMFILQRVQ